MTNEATHIRQVYAQLSADQARLTAQLAQLQAEGRSVKTALAKEGHLDLNGYGETLETFAAIESNNRQIDTLNARYHTAQTRLHHAELLLPQAYFGKLVLDYGDGEPEAVYLGKVGYADQDGVDLVYDWRAPVAAVYYQNRLGPLTYAANGRNIGVDLTQRLQLVVANERLLAENAGAGGFSDPLLQQTLAATRSGHLQAITATIQAEQDAVIRSTAHTLVVDGVAGSGKTSVLLQRVAYQLYQHRGDWRPEAMLVLTPNVAFSGYIRGVLPALGEAEPMTATYLQFLRQLGARFGLSIAAETSQLPQLAARLHTAHAMPVGCDPKLWAQTPAEADWLTRMRRVWRVLVATDRTPEDMAAWLDLDALAAAWQLPAFSAYDRLYLWLAITDYHQENVAAIFVDEAQDYSAARWLLLAQVFAKAEWTVVMDHRQRLHTPLATALLDARRPTKLALTTSYRATGAITRYFTQFAGNWQAAIQAVQPAGAPVSHAASLAAALAALQSTPDQSVAVLTQDPQAIALPAANLLTADGRTTLRPGVNVLALEVAKGLEFDHAIILDWQGQYYTDPDYGQNRRYVAASRATKSLTLVN